MEATGLAAALRAFDERREAARQDAERLAGELAEAEALRDEAEAGLAALEYEAGRALQDEASALSAQRRARDLRDDAGRRLRELAIAAQARRREVASARAHLADTERALQGCRDESARAQAAIASLAQALEDIDSQNARAGLAEAVARREAAAQAATEAQNASDAAEAGLKAARAAAAEAQAGQQPVIERMGDLKADRQAAMARCDALAGRLIEEGADREGLRLLAMAPEAKIPSLKARASRLAGEIAALGPVNHAAAESLAAARAAAEQTGRQVEDLQAALANLEASIAAIDAQTRDLMASTFEAVNANFGEMFAGLFGGGSARLSLTGGDVLDAGVDVFAHPPGKKNASVKLLSGGEQALTATALVFALFKLNPAPFCLLDEVDAPLDEANQERLARQVLAMSERTQFMVITHHRVTMEHLSALIGVTMKEPGVSRIVAVDVSEARAMAGPENA
ncbi:MAG: hypothetical protein HUK26_02175 [Duodenibacillus sp.]|nr:hypothetical protein [Duodenibacillus sp.]